MTKGCIRLRGVAVHNLKEIDLDLPHEELIVFCGLSGSGKTSLALDTLYAEGQRRYIESFSAYARQFLERLEKPAAERIDGIPPAVAVTHKNTSRSNRATVATATEIYDYLRLVYARAGEVFCSSCGRPVRRDSPQSAAAAVTALPAGARLLAGFAVNLSEESPATIAARLREAGFVRLVVGERTLNLGEMSDADFGALVAAEATAAQPAYVIIDRLTTGGEPQRLRDSLETAFTQGDGVASIWVELAAGAAPTDGETTATIDGRRWRRLVFSRALRCHECGLDYLAPEPRLFSFNSPLGACPACEGFGNTLEVDLALVVPDPQKSLRDGAIAPWNTPAYAHELKELLEAASRLKLDVDAPFRELPDEQRRLVVEGSAAHSYGGLRDFFARLEKRKYQTHLRAYLARWRSHRPCTACGGTRLRPEALAVRIGGRNLPELCRLKIADAVAALETLPLSDWQRQAARNPLDQAQARLRFLAEVGLGYLALDRPLRTLSGGEAQRAALTSALGSTLVQMLYVLDEPSVGLHPADVSSLYQAVRRLQQRGNTVVVVEHEESFLRSADQIVEIGPGAGESGGRVVFQGTPAAMLKSEASLTGAYLSGKRGGGTPTRRRSPAHGWIRLAGARGNNLQNLTVEFPLGVLCVVTGVSGAGKSTLVQDTLYPALLKRMRQEADTPLPHDSVLGDGQFDDVLLVDQSPIGRSPRSNPVTYIKAFDAIREVFAETLEARTNNFTASQFSFNVDGGRCNACEGDGYLAVDMQFLADVYMKCSQCHGRRYRREILQVKYRGRNIADVLDMTVREAFTFFRGHPKVQARLKRLIDVGLDYLRLGQGANTLSGGEAQRLKLASYISATRRGRTLFLMDEPTTGLHFSDVVQLLDCFDSLLAVGHSLIVVEHNLQLMKAADYLIDLGPGAGEAGGMVVAKGAPEAVARCEQSVTGKLLREALK